MKNRRCCIKGIWIAVRLVVGLGLITYPAKAAEMSIEEAVQVAQSAVSRAQAADGQARVVVAWIEYEMKGLRLAEARLAQQHAEAQAHIAMDALQRALTATHADVAQAAATAAQAAAVTAQTRANIAVAHMQIELMLNASQRLYGHRLRRLGRREREEPVRWPGQETNTFTLPELRAAIFQSIVAVNRAIERADETERQVQRIDDQMQVALSATTPQAAKIALLAAEAAQADALVRASAAQIDVSEVMAQATKDENALGAVNQIDAAMQSYLEAIESAAPILPTMPVATVEPMVWRAVTRSAVARAQTAAAQAEVALAQAGVLKIDLEPFKKTVEIVYARLQATETTAALVATAAGGSAVAAAQAAAAAAVAWSQIAISDIQLAIARATRDDSEELKQLILAAETRLQEARRWAVEAEASADVAMEVATQAADHAAAVALVSVRLARQAVARAQAQAQVSVAKAQAAMLDVQLAVARARHAHQTAEIAEQATILARLAAKEVQLNFTLSTVATNAIRTVSAIVTVAAAVMPTRPRTWYEEEGTRPYVASGQSAQVSTQERPAFDDLTPPTSSCGVSCSR